MASKKYVLIVGLLCLIQSSFAQNSSATYNWSDSTKIPAKRMAQHNEFMNNQYPYPAKPRDMWELGIGAGYAFWKGDMPARFGYGGNISLRKALGHVFSVRFGYVGSINKGYDYRPRNPLTQVVGGNASPTTGSVNPWAPYLTAPQGSAGVFTQYRSRVHQGTVELVAALNNISWYRGNPKTSLYGFVGYTAAANDVDVDARDASGNLYNFTTINWQNVSRKDIRNQLKSLTDGDYESNAPVSYGNKTIGRIKDNYILVQGVTAGMGLAKRFSPKFNVALEQRFSYFFDDNMDGVVQGQGKDIHSFTSFKLNFNLGSAAKRVEPLWWLNPNNYLYNEINRPTHMNLPKPILPDADNDGVTDQFDLEPNTPAGAPVDSHGVSRDTDGDGVPDYKDKELLTQQSCFPVNADGVGNCPEPACCKELRARMDSMGTTHNNCGLNSLPSVQFKSGTVSLSKDAQTVLAGAASQIKSNPNCRVKVVGYGAADKRAQQLSWDRVNAVIRYLVEQQGISEDRFIFSYGTPEGDVNTIDLQPTTEQGPNTVPAPHPNLKKK